MGAKVPGALLGTTGVDLNPVGGVALALATVRQNRRVGKAARTLARMSLH